MSRRRVPLSNVLSDVERDLYERRLQHNEDTIVRLESELRRHRDQTAEVEALRRTADDLRKRYLQVDGTLSVIRAVLTLEAAARSED